MRWYQASLFTVLALTTVAVSVTATQGVSSPEAPTAPAVVSPQVRKACGAATRYAFTDFNASTAKAAFTQSADTTGPLTLEAAGRPPWSWGSCIDCSSCLSSADCAHVGGPCYDQCP